MNIFTNSTILCLARYFLLFILFIIPKLSFANLGIIQVKSFLQQNLLVTIPIYIKYYDDIKIEIATSEEFLSHEIPYSNSISLLRTEITNRLDEVYTLQITSVRPIDEPILHLLLHYQINNNDYYKQYTILLDSITPSNSISNQANNTSITNEIKSYKKGNSTKIFSDTLNSESIVIHPTGNDSPQNSELLKSSNVSDSITNNVEDLPIADVELLDNEHDKLFMLNVDDYKYYIIALLLIIFCFYLYYKKRTSNFINEIDDIRDNRNMLSRNSYKSEIKDKLNNDASISYVVTPNEKTSNNVITTVSNHRMNYNHEIKNNYNEEYDIINTLKLILLGDESRNDVRVKLLELYCIVTNFIEANIHYNYFMNNYNDIDEIIIKKINNLKAKYSDEFYKVKKCTQYNAADEQINISNCDNKLEYFAMERIIEFKSNSMDISKFDRGIDD